MKYYHEAHRAPPGANPRLAATVAYLLSDDASYVTATLLADALLHRARSCRGGPA
jgi:hypothetical protein